MKRRKRKESLIILVSTGFIKKTNKQKNEQKQKQTGKKYLVPKR